MSTFTVITCSTEGEQPIQSTVDPEGVLVYEPPLPHNCKLPAVTTYREGAIFRSACCGKLYGSASGTWYQPSRAILRTWIKQGKLPAAEVELPPVRVPWKRIVVGVFWLTFLAVIIWMVVNRAELT